MNLSINIQETDVMQFFDYNNLVYKIMPSLLSVCYEFTSYYIMICEMIV